MCVLYSYPVTAVTDTQVSFRAWDDLGDSGAPVYARQADGTVAAVRELDSAGQCRHLWKSDGTTSGTVRVTEQVFHGVTTSATTAAGGTLFFFAGTEPCPTGYRGKRNPR